MHLRVVADIARGRLLSKILKSTNGALNIDEKKLITQFGWKLRDERFESN